MTDAVVIRDVFRIHSTREGDAAALQGLTLRVGAGELLAVVGPSGSGKTSLLRILAGLDQPSAGSVAVFGREVAKLAGRARAQYRSRVVGYLDQHYLTALDPDLDARANVALRLRLAGVSPTQAQVRVDSLLERVGLLGLADARPSELSGGEQQRVAVCAALAHRPSLLLADEPTGELDRENADAVLALVRALTREEGTTAVLVTHDPNATAFVDRAVRIRDGRISEEFHRTGPERIVVGRGGWLRLPEELLRGAGITDHAEAAREGSRIVVTGGRAPSRARARPAARIWSARDVVAEVNGLVKTYGTGTAARTVIAGIDLRFERGTFSALTGRSGSGKTTLLNIIAGLERPTAGAVVIAGHELVNLDRAGRAAVRREAIGYVAQQPTLIPFLSARENVELALALRGHEGGEEAVLETLGAVGLAERSEQRVERLSAGEGLRVAIARAVASHPALLLADEPTSRLDEANAIAVAELLGRLARERGTAVICATHDPVVLQRADRRVDLAVPGAMPSAVGPRRTRAST
jgi:ABC-type lipoprotein export system ATPase subunit